MVVADLEQELSISVGEPFPREVEFVISALEAGPRPTSDRHKLRRVKYRARATMKLFSDPADAPPAVLYTRHVNETALGFLCARRLPLSHGGVLTLELPSGKSMQIASTILRCREAAPGWFEGAVYFNRQQPAFNAGALGAEGADR